MNNVETSAAISTISEKFIIRNRKYVEHTAEVPVYGIRIQTAYKHIARINNKYND